jgi:hypothetical protein
VGGGEYEKGKKKGEYVKENGRKGKEIEKMGGKGSK